MNGLILALAVVSADVQSDPDKLAHHRSALPADIAYVPYKHIRVNRRNGVRRRIGRARTHKRDFGRFENPDLQTPANADMFRAPGGGLTGIRGNLEVQKWRYIPGEIRTWNRRTPINGLTEHYVYPIGTRFAETIAYNGEVFEMRCIHKGADGKWEFDIDTADKTPPGYVSVSNCAECHKHAGADSHRMPRVGNQHWWGYGTAIGDDSIISHDPRQMRNARIR